MSCTVVNSQSQVQSRLPTLPQTLPKTQADWNALLATLNQWGSILQQASHAPNVIPSQFQTFTVSAATAVIAALSAANCTPSVDATRQYYGAASLKAVISTTGATLAFSGYPISIAPASRWFASFQIYAPSGCTGSLTVKTSAGHTVTESFTVSALAEWQQVWGLFDLRAYGDTQATCELTFSSTATVWLDGLQMNAVGSPLGTLPKFAGTQMVTGALAYQSNMDGVPDGTERVALASSHAAGNVAYNFKGVWAAPTTYVVGDETVYGSSYWLALAASTNSAPATGNANWQVIGTYSGFEGAWNAAVTYVPGAEVTYSGNFWVAVSENSNSAPSTSNANWQIAGPETLDQIANGETYGKPLLTALTDGQVDLSLAGVVSKNLGNIADATGRYAVTNGGSLNGVADVDPQNLALINFASSGHTNKNQDYIPNGSTYGQIRLTSLTGGNVDLSLAGVSNRTLQYILDGGGRYSVTNAAGMAGVSSVDGNNRALIDFSQSGHLSKILDNIGDGGDYARPRVGQLQNGTFVRATAGKNMLANPGFELNTVGSPVNTNITAIGANVSDGWVINSNSYTAFAGVLVNSAGWTEAIFSGAAGARMIMNSASGALGLGGNTAFSGRLYSNPIPVRGGEVVNFGGHRRLDATVAAPAGVQTLCRIGVIFTDINGSLVSEGYGSDLASPGGGWDTVDGTWTAPTGASFVCVECCAFIINNNSSLVTVARGTTFCDCSFDDCFLFVQIGLDNEAQDGTNFFRMPSPPAVSAQANTSLAQNGSTTTINVGAGTFYLGNITLNYNSGSVNPGAYGKYYIYFDDPGYAGGAVTFEVTTNPLVTSQAPGRFYVGTTTTATGGGGSGGSGGGSGCCLHADQMIELADGSEIRADELTTLHRLRRPGGDTPVVKLRRESWGEWFAVTLSNGVRLLVAGDHRFLDPAGVQISARHLRLQQIVDSAHGYLFVQKLEAIWHEAEKVSIEVGEPHTYYVQGILSHNKLLC